MSGSLHAYIRDHTRVENVDGTLRARVVGHPHFEALLRLVREQMDGALDAGSMLYPFDDYPANKRSFAEWLGSEELALAFDALMQSLYSPERAEELKARLEAEPNYFIDMKPLQVSFGDSAQHLLRLMRDAITTGRYEVSENHHGDMTVNCTLIGHAFVDLLAPFRMKDFTVHVQLSDIYDAISDEGLPDDWRIAGRGRSSLSAYSSGGKTQLYMDLPREVAENPGYLELIAERMVDMSHQDLDKLRAQRSQEKRDRPPNPRMAGENLRRYILDYTRVSAEGIEVVGQPSLHALLMLLRDNQNTRLVPYALPIPKLSDEMRESWLGSDEMRQRYDTLLDKLTQDKAAMAGMQERLLEKPDYFTQAKPKQAHSTINAAQMLELFRDAVLTGATERRTLSLAAAIHGGPRKSPIEIMRRSKALMEHNRYCHLVFFTMPCGDWTINPYTIDQTDRLRSSMEFISNRDLPAHWRELGLGVKSGLTLFGKLPENMTIGMYCSGEVAGNPELLAEILDRCIEQVSLRGQKIARAR